MARNYVYEESLRRDLSLYRIVSDFLHEKFAEFGFIGIQEWSPREGYSAVYKQLSFSNTVSYICLDKAYETQYYGVAGSTETDTFIVFTLDDIVNHKPIEVKSGYHAYKARYYKD